MAERTPQPRPTSPPDAWSMALQASRNSSTSPTRPAQYYKDHVIQEAVRQNGRKIVTDVDLALKLFNQRRADK